MPRFFQTTTDKLTMERTLILLKPDAVQRGLCGEILSRFERRGLKIAALKMLTLTKAQAEKHYGAHQAKGFYPGLIRFITSGPVVALVLEGVGVIQIARKMMGETFGSKSPPGTIRGDYGVSNSFNLIHGSDSLEAAQIEQGTFFEASELQEYEPALLRWIYDPREELGEK
jgi:nucleoside-diphosphate kinase